MLTAVKMNKHIPALATERLAKVAKFVRFAELISAKVGLVLRGATFWKPEKIKYII